MDVNLIAAAPEVVEDLDRIIHEFQRQAEVTRSLLNAERELKGKLSHNIKFNRVRPTLKFIYGPRPATQLQRRRRESMALLDHSSRAMCAIAFTPHAIQKLSDETFEALMRGIATFVQRKKLAELIESEVGHFIQRTLKDFLDDSPTPLLWVHGRTLRRRNAHATSGRNSQRRFGALARATGSESLFETKMPDQPMADEKGRKGRHLSNSGAATTGMAIETLHTSQAPSSEELLEHTPRDAARVVSPDHFLQHCDAVIVSAVDKEVISDTNTNPDDIFYNDTRASWFGRGVALSDEEVLEQLEQWIDMGSDTAWVGEGP